MAAHVLSYRSRFLGAIGETCAVRTCTRACYESACLGDPRVITGFGRLKYVSLGDYVFY